MINFPNGLPKIKALLEHDPNIRLVMEATSTLVSLLKTRYSLSRHEGKSNKDAITNVLTELAIPLGVNLGSKFPH